MKTYNTMPEIESRITEIRVDLRYRVNLDTDRAVNLQGELEDLEIKLGVLAEQSKMFTITENGFSMDGTGRVAVPACRIRALSYVDASNKLTAFLATKQLTSDIELVTPLEKIAFE